MTDAAETAYDRVRYPAGLFPTTLPGRMAAIARLHGLDAPDPARARVLEIAGGDGVNLIAMAAAYPQARFHSFDLSSAAVARGRALAVAAGLTNIVIEQADLLEAADGLEGPYDHVVIHGLYSWAPAPVRDAALRLAGRVLAPDGVAFVSYNALPGGRLRAAVRDLMLHAAGDETDPVARVEAAYAALRDFVVPRERDRPAATGLRSVAEPMLRKSPGALFHDELGDVYEPQAFADVVAAGAAHGLGFLNDAMPAIVADGFPGAGTSEEAVVRAAQRDDHLSVAFFHQTLLVRAGLTPARSVAAANVARLYAAAPGVRRLDGTRFARGEDGFEIGDSRLADFLEMLGMAHPRRLSLERFGDSGDHAEALVRLYQREAIELHADPTPAALEPGERPIASPVARAQIRAGETQLFTLDHRMVDFADASPRAFLSLLDGTRDRARLAADWAASGHGGGIDAEDALAQLARAAMILN